MSSLKASIVTPMYNAEKTIQEMLSALNRQTEKNFELIIVNDGSKDNSLEIIKNFRANFPLRILTQKNSGPAVARNNGAKSSSSDIIVFLDSDCVPRPDFLQKILVPFDNPEVVGVQAETETQNKYSTIARYVSCEIYYRHEPMKKLERIDHVSTCACAYRKRDFNSGFSTNFKKADMEDIEFSYRLAEQGKKLVFQPDSVVGHYHPEGFWKFMRLQFQRGYWRVSGHKTHPEKMIKDSYLGFALAIQGGISLLFLASLLASIIVSAYLFSPAPLTVPIASFILLFISNLPFGVYSFRYEKKMIFLAPLIASCRSIAGTLGFLKGNLEILFK